MFGNRSGKTIGESGLSGAVRAVDPDKDAPTTLDQLTNGVGEASQKCLHSRKYPAA